MYDDIASLYHLVYPNWNEAIAKQGTALNGVISNFVGAASQSILDVSCGIGTQAIGLATLGHNVTASDLSAAAVARAHKEALSRGLEMTFKVADMRQCAQTHGSGFDVVLSADNSLPHLPGEDEIRVALQGFYQCLRQDGVAIVSLREYLEDEDRSSPQMWSYGFRDDKSDRYFVFQTRDWSNNAYDVAMYFVREVKQGIPASVTAGLSRYYAITVERLMFLFREVGFTDVQRLDGILHQPIIVGRRVDI
ncbi:class I SAM-dependent methyltransferase [Gloeocapsopsis crepidinum LEGE 06123]|uniref:Class I SAM-dependent methyltransferase n=1 Tax=Gloeocapsopsis crepidinum LEGE 06123 TaxID=588587 RepID=A0ABR9UMG2_9CHRO|nr:class I SAM-dependent methyltransferase [Gloeocapsopsis crepidinum]MBE9189477.1 class I SAM-dependent methyltransferase [Gloeocapsopsis crepidinum LEGE 06123]